MLCDETHTSEAEGQVSGLCPEISQNDKKKESHNLFSLFNMIVKIWEKKKKVKVIHKGQKQVIVPGADCRRRYILVKWTKNGFLGL